MCFYITEIIWLLNFTVSQLGEQQYTKLPTRMATKTLFKQHSCAVGTIYDLHFSRFKNRNRVLFKWRIGGLTWLMKVHTRTGLQVCVCVCVCVRERERRCWYTHISRRQMVLKQEVQDRPKILYVCVCVYVCVNPAGPRKQEQIPSRSAGSDTVMLH